MILASDGTETVVEFGPKAVLAAALWDAVAPRLSAGTASGGSRR